MHVDTAFHIAAGAVGLISGAAALCVAKGSRLHRIAGSVFVVSMLTAAGSAAFLAFFARPYAPAVAEGLLVFYWVVTAWATAKNPETRIGFFGLIAPLLGTLVALVCLIFGREAAASPDGLKDEIPASIYFVFAGLAAFSALLDASIIFRRGIFGSQRVMRHLWRMTTALLFAVTNFFIGNGAVVFPSELRASKVGPLPTLSLPSLLVFALLLFWLVRVALGWPTRPQHAVTRQP